MFRLFEKYIAFNTYANTIQNLFIVLTQTPCIYNEIESYAFPSYLHPTVYVFTQHQSKVAFTKHLNVHFYFQQYSQLLHSAMYILCYVNETYLQPMFLLCDIFVQFYHDIKATQLLHKHIFSYVTHMKNICSLCVSYVMFQHGI